MWDRLDSAGVVVDDRAVVEQILTVCKGLAAEKRRDLTHAEVREAAQAVLSPIGR
jgi:hypothetical protein